MHNEREFFLGVILSTFSWETWENVFISILIAFVGGIAAAAGKTIYNRIYARFGRNKKNHEKN